MQRRKLTQKVKTKTFSSKAIKLVFKDKGKKDKENPFEHPDNKILAIYKEKKSRLASDFFTESFYARNNEDAFQGFQKENMIQNFMALYPLFSYKSS